MPYEQPEYLTGLQNAAQAFLQGLQERHARERENSLRREQDERLKQNFLRDMMYQQAREGNTASAKYLDKTMGMESTLPNEVAATAGPILSRRGGLNITASGGLNTQLPKTTPETAGPILSRRGNLTVGGPTQVIPHIISPEARQAQQLLHGELEAAKNAISSAKSFKDREAAIQNYNQVSQNVSQQLSELRKTGKVPAYIPHNYPSAMPTAQKSVEAMSPTAMPETPTGVLRKTFSPGVQQQSLESLAPTSAPTAPTGVLAGPFERYAAEQKGKYEKAQAEKQAQVKREEDESFHNNNMKMSLAGLTDPAELTRYLKDWNDYKLGKTNVRPTLKFREKPDDSAASRAEAAKNRRVNMLLMAGSRIDNKVVETSGNIDKIWTRWQSMLSENPDLGESVTPAFLKRIGEQEKILEKFQKDRQDLDKAIQKVSVEEGVDLGGFGEETPDTGNTIKRQGAETLFQRLQTMGVNPEDARKRVIADYGYDPIAKDFISETVQELQPGLMYQISPPQTAPNQADGKIKVEY